jgi:cytochrome c peroxidase
MRKSVRPAPLLLLSLLGPVAVAAFMACSDDPPSSNAIDVDSGSGSDAFTPDAPDTGSAGWTLTIQEMQLAKSQSPLPAVPPSPGNKYADNPAAATLGQKFYFDKSIAGPILQAPNDLGALNEAGKVSCASCHMTPWGSDMRSFPNALSLGTSWTTRNSGPIVNVAFYTWFYWDGRTDSLWQQAAQAGENALQQNSDRLRIGHVVYTKYKAEYEAIFGVLDSRFDPADLDAFPASGKPGNPAYDALAAQDKTIITAVLVNWAKAIEAYERLLVSRDAPWDKFVAGDANAISQRAIHGYKLFTSKGYCVSCHSGPLFSDNGLHNIGVPNHGQIVDKGRYDTIVRALTNPFRADGIWSDDRDAGSQKLATQFDFDAGLSPDGGPNFSLSSELGMFRTKHLRQIEHTGPYMHNGSLHSLEDVMALYRTGGGDSGIGTLDIAFAGHVAMTLEEEADVVEFMKTLTGAPVPEPLLLDTSKP